MEIAKSPASFSISVTTRHWAAFLSWKMVGMGCRGVVNIAKKNAVQGLGLLLLECSAEGFVFPSNSGGGKRPVCEEQGVRFALAAKSSFTTEIRRWIHVFGDAESRMSDRVRRGLA